MPKNLIQAERMRGYFIDSAKSIIKSEGTRALSVRNVAAAAGYSYATIYQHFANLKEIVLCCLDSFIKEVEDYVLQSFKPNGKTTEEFMAKNKEFAKFFVQYPSLFELIFIERISDAETNSKIIEKIDGLFFNIFENEWKKFSNEKGIEFNKFASMHKNMLVGMLSIYLFRNYKISYKEFMADYEAQLKYLLNF